MAGDRVRVKPHTTPQAGWGAVKKTSVGIVKEYNSKQNNKVCQYLYFCTIKASQQSFGWDCKGVRFQREEQGADVC